ncbi:STAS/SEC14 domain-containing protein [Pseudenhygromyxa sp. WMMC2535]|uniref:STAS/SEC14 domain-containing protein n=1 Tax=Pseudenhygromyxa sp. WMMC2535 TaxID=2712867 RepID=UPI001554DDE3|nr:STAS/SEC14 domain-containing protein [Pseudenhygromyxa sp. WMMC2535]NVB37537.1 STAS/SEC14 domain-containing protein [Pseudenhygromyxa sp. WMMC2535]
MAKTKTFLYEVSGKAHIAVHGKVPPSDEEWQAYLDHIVNHVSEIRGVLVSTLGGGPSTAQRRAATEHWNRYGSTPKMAIMTVSPIVRGMVKALSWFLGTNLRAFALDDYENARKYLGLGETDIDEIAETVERLRGELGLPQQSAMGSRSPASERTRA